MEEDGIGVTPLVLDRLGGLGEAAAEMDQRLVEALIDRSHRIAVAQVPFAENTGRVPCRPQKLGDRDLCRIHHRPALKRVEHARAVVVAPGHQACTRRGTDRADVKVGHPGTACRHGVDVGRLEHRIAHAAQITVPLIVRHDQHDVGARGWSGVGRWREGSMAKNHANEGNRQCRCSTRKNGAVLTGDNRAGSVLGTET